MSDAPRPPKPRSRTHQPHRSGQRSRPHERARPADVQGLPARMAALKMLDAVLRRGEALDRASHAATLGIKGSADRALAIAIAAEALRHLPDLDALIDSATRLPMAEDAKARQVLRIALVQMLKLGTPAHAAIATALPLVTGGPKRLVHGVFGTIARSEIIALPDPPTLPPAVALRWGDAWGKDHLPAAAQALGHAPPLDLTVRDGAQTDVWAERLGGISLAPGHVRMDRAGDVAALPGYDDGVWWVQDIAATLPARMLGAGHGHVLDMCAAPGGKTMQLAAAGWQVTAVDQSAKRNAVLDRNLARTGLSAQVITADLLSWQPTDAADAILLDAPCSATGIFRRHPDVLHRIGDADIATLSDLQSTLLARAADWVKPGGALVYATCSLEPAEGEEQIDRFLATHLGWRIIAPDAAHLPTGISVSSQGWVRTLPGTLAEQGGCDGFFAVRLERP